MSTVFPEAILIVDLAVPSLFLISREPEFPLAGVVKVTVPLLGPTIAVLSLPADFTVMLPVFVSLFPVIS